MSPRTCQHSVLRARIGVEYPDVVARTELEQRLVNAITAAVNDLGGRLDVLQLDLAARPDWDQFGPTNRVTGEPLWDRPSATPGN